MNGGQVCFCVCVYECMFVCGGVCLLGACINFLLLNNNCIMYLASESSTPLLAYLSIGLKSNGSTGFSVQGPTRLISK